MDAMRRGDGWCEVKWIKSEKTACYRVGVEGKFDLKVGGLDSSWLSANEGGRRVVGRAPE